MTRTQRELQWTWRELLGRGESAARTWYSLHGLRRPKSPPRSFWTCSKRMQREFRINRTQHERSENLAWTWRGLQADEVLSTSLLGPCHVLTTRSENSKVSVPENHFPKTMKFMPRPRHVHEVLATFSARSQYVLGVPTTSYLFLFNAARTSWTQRELRPV